MCYNFVRNGEIMRRRDREAEMHPTKIYTKAAKTISFTKIVLIKLEQRAKTENRSVSDLVDMICRRVVMTDPDFFREMAKHHLLEFNRYQYMKQEALEILEIKN